MIERLKNICDYISRGATPDYVDDSPYKVMNQATFSKGFIDETNLRYSSKNPYGAQIHKGDLLMASTGGGILGKVVYFDKDEKDFYADSHVSILRNSKGTNLMKFLYYYFLIRYDEINATMVKGSTNQTELQRNYLVNYELDIPSLPVQRRIVSYLDSKTSAIDHAISLLERKREAYTRLKASVINRAVTRGLNPNVKIKDSGVEWIGKIPEGWKSYRMKDIGYMYSGLAGKSGEDFRSEDASLTQPYIPFTNVLNHIEIDPLQMNYVVMSPGEVQNKVRKNDLIFLMSSEDYESIAKSAVVLSDLHQVYLNSFCRGFRTTCKDVEANFLNYELNSEVYRSKIRLEARGFTRINIKVDRIETMYVVLPPLSEQRSIASYLDAECSKIDRAASIVEKQIDAYKRLKRSLINEVVTGKRKVD